MGLDAVYEQLLTAVPILSVYSKYCFLYHHTIGFLMLLARNEFWHLREALIIVKDYSAGRKCKFSSRVMIDKCQIEELAVEAVVPCPFMRVPCPKVNYQKT